MLEFRKNMKEWSRLTEICPLKLCVCSRDAWEHPLLSAHIDSLKAVTSTWQVVRIVARWPKAPKMLQRQWRRTLMVLKISNQPWTSLHSLLILVGKKKWMDFPCLPNRWYVAIVLLYGHGIHSKVVWAFQSKGWTETFTLRCIPSASLMTLDNRTLRCSPRLWDRACDDSAFKQTVQVELFIFCFHRCQNPWTGETKGTGTDENHRAIGFARH